MVAKYSVVIPIFNEELIINETYSRLKEVMDKTNEPYELIFVNDGSNDSSHKIIFEICKMNPHVKLLDFSRNFGHQIAIGAGLDYAEGEAIISIDADLQDPPEVILEMIRKWKEGYNVVYGKRVRRDGDAFLKKVAIKIYYRLLRILTNYDIPADVGDFRLIDREVCNVIRNLPEKNRYLRGLVTWIGFNQTFVEYARKGRIGGESKYSLAKLFHLAISGITSFSYKPLRLASYIGIILSICSFFYLVLVIYLRIANDIPIGGWASMTATNLFFYGIVLIILGIMGEYIGKIYEETKNKPLYILKGKKGFK